MGCFPLAVDALSLARTASRVAFRRSLPDNGHSNEVRHSTGGGGNVAGDSHGFEYWNIYRIAPTSVLLRQGTGELLSLSKDLPAVRVNNEIQIERMTAQPLGSFAVPPRSTCYAKALLLGPNRLYLNGCGPGRVVDFRGKTTVEIPEPDGWGFRYGLTEDGHRMLFDKYTRRISVLQRMAESVESLTTFGMGPIVTSKGEIIRVVDADAGKICLDLDSPDRKLGRDANTMPTSLGTVKKSTETSCGT